MEGMIVLYGYVAYLLFGVLVELLLSRDTHFVTNHLRWEADLPGFTDIVPLHSWPIYLVEWIRYRGALR